MSLSLPNVRNVFVRASETERQLTQRQAYALLTTIALDLGYTILGKKGHTFSSDGVTAVLVLSESHISLHTWPETRFAVIEMVTCKPFGKAELKRFLSHIQTALLPKRLRPILNT